MEARKVVGVRYHVCTKSLVYKIVFVDELTVDYRR